MEGLARSSDDAAAAAAAAAVAYRSAAIFVLTSELELGGGLGRVALGAPHDALVHAPILPADAANAKQLRLSAGARKLAAVLVPADEVRPRLEVGSDLAAKLCVAAQVDAQQRRRDFHEQRRRHDQPKRHSGRGS
jgi:hypothetical protein